MKTTTLLLVVPVLAGLFSLSAQAQGINHRLHNQHARIEAGERSGELTNREADRLERRDANIHRSERRDRKAHDGKLTRRERRNLQRRLNHDSRSIYRQKHDGQGRDGKGEDRKHDGQNR